MITINHKNQTRVVKGADEEDFVSHEPPHTYYECGQFSYTVYNDNKILRDVMPSQTSENLEVLLDSSPVVAVAVVYWGHPDYPKSRTVQASLTDFKNRKSFNKWLEGEVNDGESWVSAVLVFAVTQSEVDKEWSGNIVRGKQWVDGIALDFANFFTSDYHEIHDVDDDCYSIDYGQELHDIIIQEIKGIDTYMERDHNKALFVGDSIVNGQSEVVVTTSYEYYDWIMDKVQDALPNHKFRINEPV